MSYILLSKHRTQVVNGVERTIRKRRKYYLEEGKDFNSQEGFIKKEDIKPGKLRTSLGREFYCFRSNFADDFQKIRKRGPQSIMFKDIGFIVTEGGLTKDSVVVEGGTGAGALTSYLAKLVKKVYSYETREDHLKLAEKNLSYLDVDNVKMKQQDMCEKIDESDVDAVILDLPNPWDAIEQAKKSVKVGSFIIAYTPTIIQASNFVEAVKEYEELDYVSTRELINRDWKVEGKAVRPSSKAVGHTAFLTFVRRIY